LERCEDELAEILQDADNPKQLAAVLNFNTPDGLAEYLGVDRSQLAALLDSARSDDDDEGSANTGDDEEPANSNNGSDESTPGVSQEPEQEAESGDLNQSFTVTSSGDNSNQSASVQGTVNTGNAQNQVDVEQVDSSAKKIEVEGAARSRLAPSKLRRPSKRSSRPQRLPPGRTKSA